jgi:hypothetical protein
LTTGILFPLFTRMHFWEWEILWRWSACAPTAYEVVRDCRKLRNTALDPITSAAETAPLTDITLRWIHRAGIVWGVC